MTLSAGYSIGVGLLMVLQWTGFLARGQVTELRSAPWEIGSHLTAEFLTSVLLFAGGIGLVAEWPPRSI